jgi:hypothetical protein
VDDLEAVDGDKRAKKLEAALAEAGKESQAGDPKYKLIILLMMGDPKLLIDGLMNTVIPKEVLNTVKMVLSIIEQNEETFKELVSTPAKFKEYTTSLATYMIGPLITFIKGALDERMKSSKGIELAILTRAASLLSKPDTLTNFVMLLHYIKYRTIRKENMMVIIKFLFGILQESLSGQMKELFPEFIKALSGFEDLQNSDKTISFGQRRKAFIHCFVKLCIPDLEPRMPLIEQLIDLCMNLVKMGGNKTLMKESSLDIAEQLASLMGINPKQFHGLLGVLSEDTERRNESIINFVSPLVKLSESTLKAALKIFSGVKKSIKLAVRPVAGAKEKGKGDDAALAKMDALNKKVTDGTASVRELFDLVDMEGDSSGGISRAEFALLMKKLNMPMTDHRIADVFARCKTDPNSREDELNFQGKYQV